MGARITEPHPSCDKVPLSVIFVRLPSLTIRVFRYFASTGQQWDGGAIFSPPFADPSGVLWRLKLLAPGSHRNPMHLAVFLEVEPDQILKSFWQRNVSFTFTARPHEDGAVDGAVDGGESPGLVGAPELSTPPGSPRQAALQAGRAHSTTPTAADPTAAQGGDLPGGGQAAAAQAQAAAQALVGCCAKSDVHLFRDSGDRDWGF